MGQNPPPARGQNPGFSVAAARVTNRPRRWVRLGSEHEERAQFLYRWQMGHAAQHEDPRRSEPGKRRSDRHDHAGRSGRREPRGRRREESLPDLLENDRRRTRRVARENHRRIPEAHARHRRNRLQGNGRADRPRQHGAGAGRSRPHRVHAECDEDVQVGRRQRPQPHRSRTDRRVRADHAVELAAESDRRESGARDRCRLHDDPEADRDRAAERDHLRRSDGRSRRAAGRVQPRERRRPRRGRCTVVAPRRRHGVVHRFDARRHLGGAERGTDRQARHAGTRRQVGQHPARRCRFPESGRARHGLVRHEQRPVV